MIQTDPAIQITFGRALRRRELTAFLGQAALAAGLKGSVSVLLTGDEEIRRLNRDFRRKDKATDVLSFPAAEIASGKVRLAGDLAISVETASRQAEGLGHPVAAELKILTLHGLLHLAGYDHETDSGEMARKESALRKRFGLSAGLIERTESRDQGSGIRAKKASVKKATAKKATAKTATVKKTAAKGKRP
jgi:probable rRNA maturation factor